MKVDFIFNYPWWFILLCIAVGVLASAILYWNNRTEDFQPWKQWLLAGFRFAVITAISFLLLAPLLRLQVTNTQQPVILIFQDNSQSVLTSGDSTFYRDEYISGLDRLTEQLESTYQVSAYAFGETVSQADTFSFNEKITDMSAVFESVDVLYSNRNIGAVIIAGDGIYNRGRNPLYNTGNVLYPIYTIALGDTIPKKDLIINNIRHNRITYLNNIFPLEVTIEARQAAGLRSRLRVFHQGTVMAEQPLIINSDSHFQTFTFELEAKETGIKRFRIELDAIDGEVSTANNVREFFIEVIDSRQKVLIMAAGPHPDVGALKQALDANENYETRVSLVNDFKETIRDYDIVIWHQLPSGDQNASALIAAAASIPQLFIVGARSNINEFNRLQTGIQMNIRTPGFNDSRAEVNNTFNLFRLSAETSQLISLLPPLQSPFAAFTLAPGTQTLFYQRIANVTTDYPLIAFSQVADRKTGVITGEGIWRWRLNNFLRHGNHMAFNELVSKMIQFLAVVEDKSFFRVTTENFLMENEPAIFDAELYNASYELINTPDVNLTITNEEGTTWEYVFGRTGNSYRLNAGVFPVGEYRYSAATRAGDEEYTVNGLFTVSPLNIEEINTVANHRLLFQMAGNSGGRMYFPQEMDQLAQEIQNRADIKPVLYSQYQYEDLISLRWIFFLLLAFLSVEWFVRKYSGSY